MSGTPNTTLAAQWYADRLGWSVLPVHFPFAGGCSCGKSDCTAAAKHPALRNGVSGARREVSEWWPDKQWNVGVATGAVSGVWVLDVDGHAGVESIRDLERQVGQAVPKTVTARTGGGGYHLFWSLPSGARMGNRVGVLPNVDVRGDGGYVVAPPSLHVSGPRYRWLDGRGPHEIALAGAPTWLVHVATVSRANVVSRERHDWVGSFHAKVPEGQRNHAVAQRAGYLLRLGMDREVAAELLTAWVESRCTPPLPAAEVRRTVLSIARREMRRRATESNANLATRDR